MPAICIVLASEKLDSSRTYLVRLIKSFRRQRCLAEVARKTNVCGTFESNGNTSVSHLTLQQQDELRSKTHSHWRSHHKCRIQHWPPHCSRFLQRYPSMKGHLISGAAIVLINIRVSKPWGMSYGNRVQCVFSQVRCAMEYLQTIVNVLHAVEQRNGMNNICCYYFLDPQRDFDEDWWLSLSRISKQWTCLKRTFSFCFEPFLAAPCVRFTSSVTYLCNDLHRLFSMFTRKNIEQCRFHWSFNLTSAILSFICVGWLDMMMWHACDRRYLVGDRVVYEHKQRDSSECKVVLAVVTTITPSFLSLTLDTSNTISGGFQVTLHRDLTRWKPMRRCVFDGDVVSVFEHNAVVIGVVRQEARESVEHRTLDGFPSIRVQLMHENRYVYPSLGDVQFSFKLCTGSCIPGSPLSIE